MCSYSLLFSECVIRLSKLICRWPLYIVRTVNLCYVAAVKEGLTRKRHWSTKNWQGIEAEGEKTSWHVQAPFFLHHRSTDCCSFDLCTSLSIFTSFWHHCTLGITQNASKPSALNLAASLVPPVLRLISSWTVLLGSLVCTLGLYRCQLWQLSTNSCL